MSTQSAAARDHDEVYDLLPWYVNRTLESKQIDLVSQHINQCTECQREVQFLRVLCDGIAEDANEQYREHADIEHSLSSVMDKIDLEENNRPSFDSWVSRLKDNLSELSWRSLDLPTQQWAAIAAAGVLAVGLGGMMYVSSTNDDYTVLSSPDTEPLSLRLVVDVEAPEYKEAALSIISIELEKIDRNFMIEEDPQGSYTVIIEDAISVHEVNDVINILESKREISEVSMSQ